MNNVWGKRLVKYFALLVVLVVGVLGLGGWLYWREIAKKPVSIVYGEFPGGARLGNQLWASAHIYAYCKEKGYDLFLPAFNKDYAYYFEHFRGNYMASAFEKHGNSLTRVKRVAHRLSSTHKSIAKRILKKLANVHKVDTTGEKIPLLKSEINNEQKYVFAEQEKFSYLFDGTALNENSSIFEKGLDDGVYYIRNWGLAWSDGVEKYGNDIRELFRPHEEYVARINNLWERVPGDRLVVGVHIRQGDLIEECCDSYYHASEVYANKMRELKDSLAGEDPVFIVCSDDKQKEEDFEGLDVIITGGRDIEDLYSLARCDLVIGTRFSTYSGWAAWYGRIPRIFMEGQTDYQELKNQL